MAKIKLYVARDHGRYVAEANDAEVLKFIIAQAGHKRIAVIGDVMVDTYIYGADGGRSPEADTPVINKQHMTEFLGGAAHVAEQLQAFGGNVKLFSIVGNDRAGSKIQAAFPDVVADPFVTTTKKRRLVVNNKQIARIDSNMESQYRFDVGETLTYTKGFKESLETANVIVISDYNKGIVCQAVLDLVHDVCARRSIPLIVDPKRPPFERYFPAVTIAPNIREFAAGVNACGAIFQQRFFDKLMASYFIRSQVDNIVVTRGEGGVRIASRHVDEAVDFPALKTDTPNVVGAGDIITAYLAAAEAANVTIIQAARLANIAAGLAVRKEGTPIVIPDEIFSHLRDNINGRTD